MSQAHAFFPPSSMAEIVACARFARMLATMPDHSDPEPREEGEAAHWLAAQMLAGDVSTPSVAPNGRPITDEMRRGAALVCATLTGDPKSWAVEQTLGDRSSLFFGTPDYLRVTAMPGHVLVEIPDYKFGFEWVDVVGNWQLLSYAILWLRQRKIDGAGELDVRFRFTIIQPRAYGKGDRVRTWEISGGELRTFRNIIDGAQAKALEPEPPATVGPQCEHCPGRAECPTLQRVGAKAIQHRGDGSPLNMTPEAVGVELTMVRRTLAALQARETGLAAEAEAHRRAGRAVTGWTLASSEGREGWTVPDDQVIAAGDALGVKLSTVKAITPNQARDAGLAPEIVAALSKRKPGAMKLVEEDPNAAARAFGVAK